MVHLMEREAEELQLLLEEKNSTNTKRNTKAAVKHLREDCSVVSSITCYVVTNQLLQGVVRLRPSCDNLISCVQISMSHYRPCNN